MTPSRVFVRPIVRSIFSVAEEEIYSFRRRCVFAPGITDNFNIKFCTVTGAKSATSQSHIHPGDEIVIALEGENINFANDKIFPLRRRQAIAIPPGTEHSTLVTGTGNWKGISFYCDECPHIQKNNYASLTDVVIRSINPPSFSPLKELRQHAVFSPALEETHFMAIYVLSSISKVPLSQFTRRGETVYYSISGNFFLSWEDHKMLIEPDVAAVIPSEFPHGLSVENSEGCVIVVGSCSSCSLLGLTPEK